MAGSASTVRSRRRSGLAERGVPIAPRVACDWGGLAPRLRADPGASRHYLVDGRAPLPGDIMRFPALAATLKSIAAGGPRAFYEDAAEDIVATLAARGSWLSRADFARASRRAGDADRLELSRARRGGAAAQRPGRRRARAAQYPRMFRSRFARSARAGTPASRARSGPARLWRARCHTSPIPAICGSAWRRCSTRVSPRDLAQRIDRSARMRCRSSCRRSPATPSM